MFSYWQSVIARSKRWLCEDITSHEGQTESLKLLYGLQYIISDPAHIVWNSWPWPDLIFTDQRNSVVDGSVFPLLHPICQGKIRFCRYNLNVEYHSSLLRNSGRGLQ